MELKHVTLAAVAFILWTAGMVGGLLSLHASQAAKAPWLIVSLIGMGILLAGILRDRASR